MPDIRLGHCSTTALNFQFERIEDTLRIFLMNADESGSMGGRTDQNVLAYEKVADVIGGRADLVILHGFEADSFYDIIQTETARHRLKGIEILVESKKGVYHEASSPEKAVSLGKSVLAKHQARGSTNPKSHAAFLTKLVKILNNVESEIELVVLNSSDGGFDGGPNSTMTRDIQQAMKLLSGRCGCLLAANVLVGSAGSPDALTFFTGDTERYDNRLLFSTVAASEGVLKLSDFDGTKISLGESNTPRVVVQPALSCWTVLEGDQLATWNPEGSQNLPKSVKVRRMIPKAGGRRMVMVSEVPLQYRDVTLDKDGQAVFSLIARSLSDNPYLREGSRSALNTLIAPLEALLGTRTAVLAMLTANPESQTQIDALNTQIAENTAAIRAVVDQPQLSPRERASRANALNNARHLLKAALRTLQERLEQEALEKELGFYEAHPNHWLVWLQPAIDTLKAQLELTQADPQAAMAHLSTRIRTAKSVEDGKARAADRYVDRLLAESRARRDHLQRKADPRDAIPFETPGRWNSDRCGVSGRALTDGLAAIPFVADRSDLSSGNIMAGGQNVDRMPIDAGPMLSLSAVRELMWGSLGQMASPFYTNVHWYNAAIPVLLGPANPMRMRDLERAIGWLATGTSAFAPQMAEAIPGALAVILGDPADNTNTDPQVQALLRTTALLDFYRSYPYIAGTVTFDESSNKQPLTTVWAKSLNDAGGSACLQNMGCITSLFARAVAADQVDAATVADDLFSWACRNIARGILGTRGVDGRGGIEGIKRLAAMLHCSVDLAGFVPVATAMERGEGTVVDGRLSGAALAWVLGPVVQPFWQAGAVDVLSFTEHLNEMLSRLSAADQSIVIAQLDGIFERLDDLVISEGAVEIPQVPRVPPLVSARHHQGFDDIAALEALKPQRLNTAVPGLASPAAQARRMLKAGEVSWFAPEDAGIALNQSVIDFLESHTAMRPLRAWLRLVDAGLVGAGALKALRASSEVRAIPGLPHVFPRLAAMLGGMETVILLLRRAFAFVVANAHGYADNQWATSPLRVAVAESVDVVLGARLPVSASPRHYTAKDVIALAMDDTWPKMDANGFLPKHRAIDHEGRTLITPPRLSKAEIKEASDLVVCQKACALMIEDLAKTTFVLGGLHRQGRRTLGEYGVDLRSVSEAERLRVIIEELSPVLSGRVRGDVKHPHFFIDCVHVLYQMTQLGTDTRSLVADEPMSMITATARELRALAV